MLHGVEIRRDAGLAPSVANHGLPRAESFRIAGVEIGTAWQAERIGGREEAPHQRIGIWDIENIDRTAARSLRRVRSLVVLEPLEIRQQISVTPAGLLPFIIFARMTTE